MSTSSNDTQPPSRRRPDHRAAAQPTSRRTTARAAATPPTSRSAIREVREHSSGRFFTRTAMGSVLPGSGLLLRGRVASGGALLGLTVLGAVALIALYVINGGTSTALWLAVRPNALLWVSIGAGVWMLIVAASVAYTGWLHRPLPGSRVRYGLSFLWVAFLCVALIAPVALGVGYLNIQRNLLGATFTAQTRAPGAVNPDETQKDPWVDIPRANLLILGSDAADNREGVRTDSMMVASVDTRTGATVLFGLPRNLQNVPFPTSNPLHKLYPNGYNCGTECLLNAVWTEAAGNHPDLFAGDPNPGLTTIRGVVSEILGLKMDATIVVDMAGFAELVDAFGGVDVTVKERIPIGGRVENGVIVPGSINGWIEAGHQHMDGYRAMWFARSRATTDDFSRMRRQRCLAGALIHQVDASTVLRRYPEIARVTQKNLSIDMPLEDLPSWVQLLQRIQKGGSVRSLPFSDLVIDTGEPDFARIRTLVAESLRAPSATPSATAPTSATTTPSSTPSGRSTPTPTVTTDRLVDLAEAC